jgi:uncharacterized coiled-coil protein SlyX
MGIGEITAQGTVGIVVSILGSWAALAGLLFNNFTVVLRRVEEKLTSINGTVNTLDKQIAVWSAELEHTRNQLTKLINKCEERHE